MNKAKIRAEVKKKRAELSEEQLLDGSVKIHQRFLKFLKQRPEIRHIHVFLSIERLKEVDTFPLLDDLLGRGYLLYTSILDPNEGSLKHVKLENLEELLIDDWGIPIPKKVEEVPIDAIQLVMVPLLAYDQKGNRLGYGKGYYDGFLSALNQGVLKVGVSFFDPVPQIDAEWHDIPLDYCITPQEMFLF